MLGTEPKRDPAAVWRMIESDLRESCVMRCEGRNAEAQVILRDRLPSLIREWSAGSGRSPESCRSILRELFTKAQEQVAAAMLTRRLVLSSMQVALPRNGVPAGLRISQRIPISDINGMLDALLESERAEVARYRNFPPAETDPVTLLTAG
jgi:hypothetical protein